MGIWTPDDFALVGTFYWRYTLGTAAWANGPASVIAANTSVQINFNGTIPFSAGQAIEIFNGTIHVLTQDLTWKLQMYACRFVLGDSQFAAYYRGASMPYAGATYLGPSGIILSFPPASQKWDWIYFDDFQALDAILPTTINVGIDVQNTDATNPHSVFVNAFLQYRLYQLKSGTGMQP